MTELGINVAGRGEYAPADIAALGARWARCVAYPDVNISRWIQGCHDHGVKVLLVLASESIGQAPNGWGPNIAHFDDLYHDLADSWQIGNEPDHVSPSSWTMSYADLNRLLNTARGALGPSAYLVGPGLVSGQPDWLRGVDLRPLDAIACHPYAKDPGTAPLRDLLNRYLAYGKTLWATEFHARTLGMAGYLKGQQSVQVATAFCYSDRMVQGFGLIESPPSLADFKAAAGPIRPQNMPEIIPAIDVSNYQPADVSGLVAQYGAEHVVVRASTESDRHREIAREQVASAQRAGCTVSAYIWVYWDLEPVAHVRDALANLEGAPLATVYLDCEDGNPGSALDDWLSKAVAEIEFQGYTTELHGYRAGIYTRTNWWVEQGNSRGFTRLPLWLANYRSAPALDSIPLPGGWTMASGHQWTDNPIDQSVFLRAVTEPKTPPRFQEGFAKWHALEPGLIGDPFDNEYGPTPGMSAQQTSNGWIVWANLKEGPALVFLGEDGTRHLWHEGWPASELIPPPS